MKTKKIMFLAAAAVVMLTTALLITNCLDPLPVLEMNGKTTSVRITFGDERTIMPAAPVLTGLRYDLKMTCTGTDPGDDDLDIDDTDLSYADLTDNKELLTGKSYDVEVTAYSTYDTVIVGTYISSSPVAISGSTASIPVVLQPNKTSGSGTFAWNLTYGGATNFSALTTASLGIYAITDTAFATPIGGLEDLDSDPSGTKAIPAGQYRMRITLAQTGHHSTVVTDVLHVYENLTSTYPTRNFTALTANTFTVTFNYNTTPVIASETSTESWDSLISYTAPTDHISKTGWVITDWYRTATPTINIPAQPGDDVPWDFAVDKVYSARTLFAQWAETSIEVPLSISFGPITDPMSSITLSSAVTMTIAEVKAGTYSFTFAAGSLTGVDTVTWFIGARPPTTGNSLNITDADLQYLITGVNIVNVDFTIGSDTYSKEFTFTLNAAGL